MSQSQLLTFELVGVLAGFGLLIAGLALFGKVPLNYNIRNIVVRWRVTLLTGVAFTLVVGLMTFLLAFVNGMYRLTQGSAHPGNVIVLADGALDEIFSDLGYGDITLAPQRPTVERDDAGLALASWEVYLIVNQPIPNAAPGGRSRRLLQCRGVDDPARSGRVHDLNLAPGGEWFSNAGVQALPDGRQVGQAVLGEGLARELGHDLGKRTLVPGDVFQFGPYDWVVTGVMLSAGSTFDSEIWAKKQLVGERFGKTTTTTLVLRTTSAEKAQELSADLTANFKSPAVQAQPETQYYEKLNATNQAFLYAILFVTFFIGIGGVFGVMNTMFAAISQRTKDIGVLRILGFARWQVLVSFFLEAMLIALIGGVLGCAVGSLADGLSATSTISSGGGGGKSVVIKLVVDLNILLGGLVFALGMGFVGGLLPSLSAMRLRPLESLR
jgi:hypothetical protein